MPALSYPTGNFVPNTKILSSEVNGKFTAITTLLNTTLLDSTNVQVHGLVRNGATSNLAAGTANHVLINDSNGDMSSEATLATSRGGLGANLTPSTPNLVISTGPTGTSFSLLPPPPAPVLQIYPFYRYGSMFG